MQMVIESIEMTFVLVIQQINQHKLSSLQKYHENIFCIVH